MEIEVLHIAECPNWREAGRLVEGSLEELGARDVRVTYTLLTTADEAASVPFSGSPTILVDGVDAFPTGVPMRELACRMFVSDGRLAGTPSRRDIRRVLAERMPQPHP